MDMRNGTAAQKINEVQLEYKQWHHNAVEGRCRPMAAWGEMLSLYWVVWMVRHWCYFTEGRSEKSVSWAAGIPREGLRPLLSDFI